MYESFILFIKEIFGKEVVQMTSFDLAFDRVDFTRKRNKINCWWKKERLNFLKKYRNYHSILLFKLEIKKLNATTHLVRSLTWHLLINFKLNIVYYIFLLYVKYLVKFIIYNISQKIHKKISRKYWQVLKSGIIYRKLADKAKEC